MENELVPRKKVYHVKLALVSLDENYERVNEPILLEDIPAACYRDVHCRWRDAFDEDLTTLIDYSTVKVLDEYYTK